MTRQFTLTLTNAAPTTYKLWDLIKATILDKTFANSPYVPSLVCELKDQNLTAGSTVSRNGFSLTAGSWDVSRSGKNSIDLNQINYSTDTAGAQISVQITAN